MTVETFEELLQQPENAGLPLQLINGEVVLDVPTPLHGWISHLLNLLVGGFVREHKLGWVFNEVRCKLFLDIHNSRIPDLAFVSEAHEAFDMSEPLPFIPDLIIEIKSPDDTYAKMRERAGYYLAHGARLVWLIYPEKRQIEVYPADDIVEVLGAEGELDGRDVLPGFKVLVGEIFKDRH